MSDQKLYTHFGGLGPLPRPTPNVVGRPIGDLFSLKGKVAVISGGSHGIGEAVATGFAQSGADIALWYNGQPAEKKAEELSKKYGVKVQAYKVDVTDRKAVDSAVTKINEAFGTIDIFVANAGVPWTAGGLLDNDDDTDEKEFNNLIGIDVYGVHHCARAVGKVFKAQGHGSLICTASMSGKIVNYPNWQAPYNGAKAFVEHFVRSLALEWVEFARVNSVSPGYTDTAITQAPPEIKAQWLQAVPMGRLAAPQEMVGAFVYLASDASSYATGTDIKVDGGYTCP